MNLLRSYEFIILPVELYLDIPRKYCNFRANILGRAWYVVPTHEVKYQCHRIFVRFWISRECTKVRSPLASRLNSRLPDGRGGGGEFCQGKRNCLRTPLHVPRPRPCQSRPATQQISDPWKSRHFANLKLGQFRSVTTHTYTGRSSPIVDKKSTRTGRRGRKLGSKVVGRRLRLEG